MTTFAEIIELVDEKLGNYARKASGTATGDGETTVFELLHGNITDGTLVLSIDSVVKTETTDYTVLYAQGIVTIDAAPAIDAVIAVSYEYDAWSESQVKNAINEGLYDVWSELHTVVADTTTITASATTHEYLLPTACAYLFRLDYRSSDTEGYTQEHGWRVVDKSGFHYVYIYSPQASGTYRLHYVNALVELTATSGTLEATALIPTKAKWAVVWFACSKLIAQQLSRRARSNRFFNADGANVPKVYELQRIVGDYQAMGELALKKAAKSPRVGAL